MENATKKDSVQLHCELDVQVLSWRFNPLINQLFESVRIVNLSDVPLENVSLKIISEPSFFFDSSLVLERVDAYDFAHIRDFSFVQMDAKSIIALSEKQDSLVTISVEADGKQLSKQEFVINRLPLNLWQRAEDAEGLSRFCTPDEMIAKRLSQKANAEGGTLSKKLKIIYDSILGHALFGFDNAFSSDDADFNYEMIRFSSEVVLSGKATHTELAVMLSSAILGIGGKPIIIKAKGEFFVGLGEGTGDSIAEEVPLSLIFNEDNERPIFVCVNSLLDGADFSVAEKRANDFFDLIKKNKAFQVEYYLDVFASQRRGITPFAVKEGAFGQTEFDEEKLLLSCTRVERECLLDKLSDEKEPLSKYQRMQRDILDLSSQNPLISFKKGGAGSVSIASLTLEEVEDAVSREEKLIISPFLKGDDKAKAKLDMSDLQKVSRELKTQNKLCALHEEDELSSRLTTLYRSAKKTIEETGANALFLAVGFVKWLDTKCTVAKNSKNGAIERRSPILLLPVELTRRSVKSGYVLSSRGEEAQLNLALVQNFKLNYDLDLSGLNDLPRGEFGLDVTRVIETAHNAIQDKKGWQIEKDIALGLFRFSRFAMFKELELREEQIKSHPIVKSILSGQLDESLLQDSEVSVESDNHIYLPLDADGSQLLAIKDALLGKSFVMHGPPGTGKSQTISNIIANCLAHGKRVLFVSEKAAALDVVYKRLEKLGLSDFCFELHSNKTAKKTALAQLERCSDIAQSAKEVNYLSASERESAVASGLDEFCNAMHTKTASGFSVFESLEQYYAAESKGQIEQINSVLDKKLLNKVELKKGEEALNSLKKSAFVFGEPKYSPFYYAKGLSNDAKFKEQLTKACSAVTKTYVSFNNALNLFIDATFNDDGKGDKGYDDLSFVGLYYFAKMLNDVSKYAKSGGFKRLFIKNKKTPLFRKCLKFYCENVETNSKALEGINNFLKSEAELRAVIGLKALHKKTSKNESGLLKTKDYARTFAEAARQMSGGVGLIKEHLELVKTLKAAKSLPICEGVARQYYDGAIDSQTLISCFRRSFFSTLARHEIEVNPRLSQFIHSNHMNSINELEALKELTSELAAKEIYRLAASRVPSFSRAAVASSEPAILLKAIKNGCRDMPLRALFEKIPQLITSVKPIMLMSPLTAAEYLPVSFPQFDLVIYDEASQIVTNEAIGSISRGKSAVIAGDPKQLPPTTFFKSQSINIDESFNQDLESMLDDILVLNLPSHHLRWHYRSLHESLIAFSNACYYDNSLVTTPSFDDLQSRVTLKECFGRYDRGKNRTNRVEAEMIVGEICLRIKNGEKSLGVIAFNINQAELIEDMIDSKLKSDTAFEEAYLNMSEPLFVKNLENVQGDERDVIMFSICYAPDENGKLPLNFGPLNKEGGHRRLNVAITRSRKEMRIFNSIPFDKMRYSLGTPRGVVDLFKFLSYAKNGLESVSFNSLKPKNTAKSAVVEAIAAKLKEQGILLKTNVGSAVSKVDIAIINDEKQDTYRLGIIVDTEANALIKPTRDREILKASCLMRLGWQVERIYATEFFEDAQKTLTRIKKALTSDALTLGPSYVQSLKAQIKKENGTEKSVEERQEKLIQPYEQAQLKSYKSHLFFDSTYSHIIIEQLKNVIECEGPIQKEALIRKINSAWGFEKLTQENRQYILKSLKSVSHYENDTQDTPFIWLTRGAANSYDMWRSNLDKSRSADKICKEEYASAMHAIISSCMSAYEDDLFKVVANEFSLIRSPMLNQRLSFALQLLIERGAVYIDQSGKIIKS